MEEANSKAIADMKKKIILPDSYNQPISRIELIKSFLKDWLSDKQINGMGPWFIEFLEAYSVELLLHAQKIGIEKLLLHKNDIRNFQFKSKNYPLVIIPPQPIKPKKMQVQLEEVSGGLASQVKLVPTLEEKNILDIVDHVR